MRELREVSPQSSLSLNMRFNEKLDETSGLRLNLTKRYCRFVFSSVKQQYLYDFDTSSPLLLVNLDWTIQYSPTKKFCVKNLNFYMLEVKMFFGVSAFPVIKMAVNSFCSFKLSSFQCSRLTCVSLLSTQTSFPNCNWIRQTAPNTRQRPTLTRMSSFSLPLTSFNLSNHFLRKSISPTALCCLLSFKVRNSGTF